MPQWFFISDLHLDHKKVIELSHRVDPRTRELFDSIETMNELIIERWNSVVRPADHVCLVGDFTFKNPQKYIDRLNGNIHLVIGNHDQTSQKFARQGSEARKTFASVSDIKTIRLSDGQRIIACHYPMVYWRKMERGYWHIFGHVHGRYICPVSTGGHHNDGPYPALAEDVGYDAYLCRHRTRGTPISEELLREQMTWRQENHELAFPERTEQ